MLPVGHVIRSPLELIRLYISPDQLPHPKLFDRWHIVWACNAYSHFTADGSHAVMASLRTEVKERRVQSLLLVFREEEEGWSHGWVNLLVGLAITLLAAHVGNEHETYVRSWISAPFNYQNLDIAVLTRHGIAASYLAAPFSHRPFGQVIPPLAQHQQEAACVAPFEPDEIPSERYREARWVLAKESFYAPQKTLSLWRERQENLEIAELSENLKRVYVGCSWCGTGALAELLPGTSLHKFTLPDTSRLRRDYYVVVPWP
ncbi:hypothetical protein FRC07_006602 [Ceratobasidium sp. 392]|nr:hypothetical protein FRC07_006602 [Ceratobasidium sp. 392]